MRFGLSKQTIEKICTVLRHYSAVHHAILYGSRAKGTYKNGSDIDLTLCGDTALTIDVLFAIIGELDDLLLPYTIDLSLFALIKDTDVIAHIQRVGVVFYSKDSRSFSPDGLSLISDVVSKTKPAIMPRSQI